MHFSRYIAHSFLISLALPAFFGFTACQSANKSDSNISSKESNPESWAEQMRLLEENLVSVYPLALKPQSFEKKENQEKISGALERIEQISKKVNHSPMTQLNDPSLAVVSFDFRERMELTKNAFDNGHKDFARFELLKTTQYCIECHTQSNVGPNFGVDRFKDEFKALSNLEQAEVLTATRKFDEAIKKYESFFAQSQVTWEEQFRIETAFHNALSILVSYKRDPKAAMDFIQKARKASFIPIYLKPILAIWMEDLKALQSFSATADKEKAKAAKKANIPLTVVRQWVDRANKRLIDNGNLGSEIWNLASISHLHELLNQNKDAKNRTEILWYLGSTYLSSTTHNQTSLGEKYLEACIQNEPKSALAKRCYGRLEEYVYDMYSGSGGSFVPVSEDLRLKNLKKMME